VSDQSGSIRYKSVANDWSSAYLIEIFPFAQRARGIAIFQFWGKAAQFFGTNVNPIGMLLPEPRYNFVVWTTAN